MPTREEVIQQTIQTVKPGNFAYWIDSGQDKFYGGLTGDMHETAQELLLGDLEKFKGEQTRRVTLDWLTPFINAELSANGYSPLTDAEANSLEWPSAELINPTPEAAMNALQDWFEDFSQAVMAGIVDGWQTMAAEAQSLWIGLYWLSAGIAQALRDPLALDLNHDGQITTISTDEGITFDHGATGVEYGTGWIDSGDAWLALDLNGNGVIDSGRELFGDNTIKLDGNRATDAFDALMSFDSNGDGKVDAADASGDVDLDGIMEAGETFWDINRNGVFDAGDKTFVDLRLWKDANSDGNTNADELLTLASQHVVSIGTGKTTANAIDNGNQKTATGSYTTDLDANNDSIADSYDTAQFNLTENRFFREFDSSPTVSSTAAALPNMKGSGAVRDLQEAMSLGTAEAADLQAAVGAFAAATDRQTQYGMMDDILFKWAQTSGFEDFVERLNGLAVTPEWKDDNGNSLATAVVFQQSILFRITKGNTFDNNASVASQSTTIHNGQSATHSAVLDNTYNAEELQVNAALFDDHPRESQLDALAKVRVLEAFNNAPFFNFSATSDVTDRDNSAGATDSMTSTISVLTGAGSPTSRLATLGTDNQPGHGLSAGFNPIIILTEKDLIVPNTEYIHASYDQLKESVYQSLVVQTRLKPYLDAIGIQLATDGTVSFDFTAMDALLADQLAADKVNGILDLVDLLHSRGADLTKAGWNAEARLSQLDGLLVTGSADLTAAEQAAIEATGSALHLDINLGAYGVNHGSEMLRPTIVTLSDGASTGSYVTSQSSAFVIGGTQADNIIGDLGNDLQFGGAGDDRLTGRQGDDVLFGGVGNDHLGGSEGNDLLFGGAGNDQFYSSDEGNDWVSGGAGGDVLQDGLGSDVLDGGAGDDQLVFYNGSDQMGDIDTVLFGRGDGHDTVTIDNAGMPLHREVWLQLKPDVTAEDVNITKAVGNQSNSVNLGVQIRQQNAVGPAASVTVVNMYNNQSLATHFNPDRALAGIRFADGLVWDSDDLSSLGDIKERTLTLALNDSDRFVFLRATDLLDNSMDTAEKAQWNIIAAAPVSTTGFGLDVNDVDSDGDSSEQAFFWVDNLFGDAQGVIGFLPPSNSVGSGLAFTYTMRHQSGITYTGSVDVVVSASVAATINGDDRDDILDATQSYNTQIRTLNGVAGDDILRGGDANDVLNGGDGDDVLNGNEGGDVIHGNANNDTFLADWGNDTLAGDAGDDTYHIAYLWGGDQDVIDNTTAAAIDHDSVVFSHLTDYRQLWFAQSGADLVATQLDATHNGSVTFKQWYADTDNDGQLDDVGTGRVEQFTVQQDDGAAYAMTVDAGFDNLLQAMATFTASNGAPVSVTTGVEELHTNAGAWIAVNA